MKDNKLQIEDVNSPVWKEFMSHICCYEDTLYLPMNKIVSVFARLVRLDSLFVRLGKQKALWSVVSKFALWMAHNVK